MSLVEFEQRIFRNWADAFGCPIDDALQPGLHRIPNERHAGDRMLHLWYVGQRTYLEFDPQLTDEIERVLAGLPNNAVLCPGDLAAVLGARIASHEHGLAFYLYPPDLPDFLPQEPFELRRLTLEDAGRMQALHQVCSPAEVDAGFVEVDHLIAFGCLIEGQLAAASSGFESRGFMDIGVLTHPAYRGRGLGKAAVRALCAWSIENGTIAQYRCDATNTASANQARSLNFRLYVMEEDLTVK